MWRAAMTKMAIGGAGICALGGMAGIGLANFAESGSFHFYKRAHLAQWEPDARTAAIETTDPAFADRSLEPQPAAYRY